MLVNTNEQQTFTSDSTEGSYFSKSRKNSFNNKYSLYTTQSMHVYFLKFDALLDSAVLIFHSYTMTFLPKINKGAVNTTSEYTNTVINNLTYTEQHHNNHHNTLNSIIIIIVTH